jgi:Domain of unknown function (DUF6647)
MFRQFILRAAMFTIVTAGSSYVQAYCSDDSPPSLGIESAAVQPRTEETRPAEDLLDEIVTWLSSNFDLPAIKQRPSVEFVSKAKLATMRAGDRALSQRPTHEPEIDERVAPTAQRQVVALYDDELRTIFLLDDWAGKTPADQSVLVHEMVHHLQNLGKLKFECPVAREKLAYIAQDKWLGRFGMSLEKEFDVDMFTVLVSSGCMY